MASLLSVPRKYAFCSFLRASFKQSGTGSVPPCNPPLSTKFLFQLFLSITGSSFGHLSCVLDCVVEQRSFGQIYDVFFPGLSVFPLRVLPPLGALEMERVPFFSLRVLLSSLRVLNALAFQCVRRERSGERK